jgi:hypothetical protein
MKNNADDYYLFILPLKYTLNYSNVKSMKFLIKISIISTLIFFMYIKKLNVEIYQHSIIFKMIFYFFILMLFMQVASLFLSKTKIYEAFIYFTGGVSAFQFSYLIIVIGYDYFLSNKQLLIKDEILINQFLFIIPIVLFLYSLLSIMFKIKNKVSYRYSEKTKQLEEKYKKQSIILEGKSIFLYSILLGVGSLGILNRNPYLLLLLLIICVYFISIYSARYLIISFMKYKFPEEYSQKILEKELAK